MLNKEWLNKDWLQWQSPRALPPVRLRPTLCALRCVTKNTAVALSAVALCRAGGRTVRLDAQLGDIPLHMRGGTVSGGVQYSILCLPFNVEASTHVGAPAWLDMQALAMQQGGLLTTRETKRSPLTVVVALPGVLSGEGAANTLAWQHLGAASETRITAQLYNDGGEEPAVSLGRKQSRRGEKRRLLDLKPGLGACWAFSHASRLRGLPH
jgi:hypothetical protein